MGTGAISVHSIGLVESILPGSESRANAYWGFLGTWEIPSISAPIAGWDPPAEPSPRLVDGASGLHESETPECRSGTVTRRQLSVWEGRGKS